MPRTHRQIVLLAALAAAHTVILRSSAAGWTVPANVTRMGGEQCASGVICADGAGRTHMLVAVNGQNVWSLIIENDVRTYWAPLATGGAIGFAVAGDSVGRAHAVWSQGWEIRYKRCSGSWDFDTATISDGTGDAAKADVCVDSQNNVHVTWAKGGDVWYNRRSASTGLWDGPQRVSYFGNLEPYLPPKIAAVGTAPVIIFGRDAGGENRSVWFASKESGIWTFTQLPTYGSGASSCDIDTTPDGAVHCTWDDQFDVWAIKRVNGVWSSLSGVRTGASNSFEPRVSAAAAAKVDIIWRDNAPGFGDIWGSRWNGSSWSSPASLAGLTSGGCVSPSICHDFAGRQYAMWGNAWEMWLTSDAADNTPPPAVSALAAVAGDGQITLNWTNPNAIDLAAIRIVHRTERFPASPTDGTIILNRGADWGQDSFVHTGLINGTDHYYAVYLNDKVPNYSDAARTYASPRSITCWEAKQLAENAPVNLKNKVVTAVFSGDSAIYVQEPDGSSGIRAAASGAGLAVGDRVDISGLVTMRTISGYPSERQISSPTVTKVSPGTAPKAPAMNCLGVGGGSAGPLVPGVKDGIGLNNVGLLVTIAGKVTYKVTSYIYVDDGSRVEDVSGRVGVMVRCPSTAIPYNVGDIVAVTGIVEGSIPAGWTTNRRLIHTRDWSDLRLVSGYSR